MAPATRWLELGLLFLAIPALLALWAPALALPLLFVAACVCVGVLWRDPSFQRDVLWRSRRLWPALRGPLTLAVAVGTALALAAWWLHPERLFDLPRDRPGRWVLVLLLYPALSVVPQEVVFRTFFLHRYAGLFGGPRGAAVASAAAFAWAHVVLHNGLAVALTAAGGWLFSRTYLKTRSLPAAVAEHAVYGCLLFTVGWGHWFVTGAVPGAS